MSQIASICVFALVIWWVALTLLSIRDYLSRRKAAKTRSPLTEEEKHEIEKIEAELPRKESHPINWYLQRPKEALRLTGAFLIHLPFAVLFLPLLVLVYVLPNPNRIEN